MNAKHRPLGPDDLPVVNSHLRVLTIGVGVTYVGSILFYGFLIAFSDSGSFSLVLIPLVVSAIAGLISYVWLGKLASRLGQSPIVWAGLAFIASPVGLAIAWAMIRGRVKDALETRNAPVHA